MKLVEILSRDLDEWPEGVCALVQGAQGCIYQSGGGETVLYAEPATDWALAEVTRPQWDAARARILAESQQERDPFIKELVDIACGKRSKEDQELWDKAYADAWRHGFVVLGSSVSEEYFQKMTEVSAGFADAFMAERAKRMKG